MIENDRTRLEG